jgi:hypothetical protein
MYTLADLKTSCTAAEIQYVTHKHRGGCNGARGLVYEGHYAAVEIALNAARSLSPVPGLNGDDHLRFHGQAPNCFVDDLVIYNGKSPDDIHCQIKNTASISWGRSNRSLAWNFQKQIEFTKSQKRSAKHRLAHQNRKKVKTLNKTRPNNIKLKVRAVYFPHHDSIETYVEKHDPFHHALMDVVATPNPRTTDLKWLARCLRAAWDHFGGNATLYDILTDLEARIPYIRPMAGDASINPALMTQLATIPDIVFFQHKGYLSWRSGDNIERGTLPYNCHSKRFADFEAWVLKHKPANADALAGWLTS